MQLRVWCEDGEGVAGDMCPPWLLCSLLFVAATTSSGKIRVITKAQALAESLASRLQVLLQSAIELKGSLRF